MNAFELEQGLSTAEATRRLAQYGLNRLEEPPAVPLWRRFLRQFKSPLIYILLFATAFELFAWAKEGFEHVPVEGIAIGAILLLNATLGTLQEYRSEQSLAKLRQLSAPRAWVLRDGHWKHVAGQELVPGDQVRLEAGERVPADGVVRRTHGLLIDESLLTGESVAVDKEVGGEAFSGTLAVRGAAQVEVTRTGPKSAMGRLATMLGGIVVEPTPLERKLQVLGKQLAWWVGGLSVAVGVAGVLVEGPGRFVEIVLFAVALAVAAVPEGMPAVVTLTLALGVQRMAKRNAVVRRLSAVEALGSVTVVATDKTGTLTENRMRVVRVHAPDMPNALLAMVLANDADAQSRAGDPLELALLDHALADLDPATVAAWKKIGGRPFDSAWKFMRTTAEGPTGTVSFLKGAPEVMLEHSRLSEEERARWKSLALAGACEGKRLLGLAKGSGEAETGLDWLGLVELWDPPREGVRDAVEVAQRAGIRVLMITGDHPATAKAIAQAVGIARPEVMTGEELEHLADAELISALDRVSVFARVTPEHKLRLVTVLKERGEVVAMTGDGVNDAPALKRADVGVAMGERGSDVAREVADLVLLDDNFQTIVAAIEEGRNIYRNIQSFLRFTLSTNVGLMGLVIAGVVGSYFEHLREPGGFLMLPLTALQLLWINFLGDGPPALALAVDHSSRVMGEPPRRSERLLDRPTSLFIVGSGAVAAGLGITLLVDAPGFGYSLMQIQTMIFLQQSVGKLVCAYPARRVEGAVGQNWALHLMVVLGVGLQAATVLVPALREVLGLTELPTGALAGVTLAILIQWLCANGFGWLARTSSRFSARTSPVASPA